jgi:hypothetical protein
MCLACEQGQALHNLVRDRAPPAFPTSIGVNGHIESSRKFELRPFQIGSQVPQCFMRHRSFCRSFKPAPSRGSNRGHNAIGAHTSEVLVAPGLHDRVGLPPNDVHPVPSTSLCMSLINLEVCGGAETGLLTLD